MSIDQMEILEVLERLERENASLKRAINQGRMRARVLSTLAFVVLMAGAVTLGGQPAVAQGQVHPNGKTPTLQDQINQLRADLTAEISNRTAADTTLQSNIDAEATTRATADTNLNTGLTVTNTGIYNVYLDLQNKIDGLNNKTQYLTIDSDGDMVFSGTNIYVQNGTGTEANDGKGNLIIGVRNQVLNSSHSLLVGDECSLNSAYGNVVFGYQNGGKGSYNQVTGGYANFMVDGAQFCTTSGGTGHANGGYGVWKAGSPYVAATHGSFESP